MHDQRILLVEDEGLVALDLCKQLSSFGYTHIRTARSAAQALKIAEDEAPDLAILDINIEGEKDGIELGHELQQFGDTPIVYLTAFADQETVERACETLPYGYLVKPVGERELHSTVETVLYKSRIVRERAAAEQKVRELERQLLQVQKLDAIGKLAAGIAHELNNVLLVIMGNISLAINCSSTSQSIKQQLDQAMSGCKRSANLVSQLLGFARKGVFKPRRLNLVNVVKDTVIFLTSVLGKNLQVSIRHEDSEELFVDFDLEQLQQVITNLVLNARDAMPLGGTITIEFEETYLDAPESFNPDAKPGDYILLRVTDEGEGIDPEHIDRVFDPFYSTKPEGEGTGLGLSVVFGVMQRHRGGIVVEPGREHGAKFTLFFPLGVGKGAIQHQESEQDITSIASGQRGLTLLIDDEEAIVNILEASLQRKGFVTVGFTIPEEALTWYEDNFSKVDVIVLDMKMPVQDGTTCFQQIKRINPRANVLLFSGYSADDEVENLLKEGAAGFFRKPTDFKPLIAKVSELSAARSKDLLS